MTNTCGSFDICKAKQKCDKSTIRSLDHEPEKCESSDRWKKGDESGLVEPRAFLRKKAKINLWSKLFWDQFLVRAVLGSIFCRRGFEQNLVLTSQNDAMLGWE